MNRICVILAFLFHYIPSVSGENEDLPAYALPVLQNWLHQNTDVVEVCVFREEWKTPTEEFPKGVLLRYGTITRTHKGDMKVGQRVMLTTYIEYSNTTWEREAKLRPSRISMVDGELLVSMFCKKDAPFNKGYWNVGADICRFSLHEHFYQAFLKELERDPALVGIEN